MSAQFQEKSSPFWDTTSSSFSGDRYGAVEHQFSAADVRCELSEVADEPLNQYGGRGPPIRSGGLFLRQFQATQFRSPVGRRVGVVVRVKGGLITDCSVSEVVMTTKSVCDPSSQKISVV